MSEFLFEIDRAIFYFCNQTLANPISDIAMPILTDLNKEWYGLALFGLLWLLLFSKGGTKGRIIAGLILVLISLSDQISSSVLKPLVARPRPCHEPAGTPVLANIHLLVPCGSGYSFPSSHAVNNFAVAFFLSYYYRKWTWLALLFATLIGFSRIAVGVHYPSDVLGGAIVGLACAFVIIVLWRILERRYPRLVITPGYPETGIASSS